MTQADKILKLLQDAKGDYVGGSIMNRISSQFNTRLKELKEKGHIIITIPIKDEFGFFQHRLVSGNTAHPKVKPIMHNEEKELETLSQSSMFEEKPLIKKPHQDLEN